MDPAFISPFISSVQNVFTTMLQLPTTPGDPRVKADSDPSHEITGLIGLSGDVTGAVALGFSRVTAERIVALFCGMEIDSENPDFGDAVGELVNMVSGNAKGQFTGKNVSISCPSVIIGEGHRVANQSQHPAVVIPFETDCGEVSVEIAIRESGTQAAAA